MKKTVLVLITLLMAAAVCFAACESEKPSDASKDILDLSDGESAENSKEDENSKSEDKSEDESEAESLPEGAVNVLYCSYSEKPYFAMVGTCAEGAVVTAQIGGETYSSQSYKGWFSLRLPCEGGSVDVTLTQTVDGEAFDIPREYTARPKTPGADMWPVVTGGDFQFFFQKMLPDFQHKNGYADSVYASLTSRIETRLDQLHSYNPDAEMIYLIVPSAMTVYPELVPEEYAQGSGMSRLDKTVEAINNAGATAIDLTALFKEHKNDEMPLYYKLDSHWADYGAYVAYNALFEHISQKYPEAAPRTADEFDWNPDYYESGDMTYYLAMSQQQVKEYAYYRTFNFDAPKNITSIPRYRSDTMLCYSDNVTWEHTIKTNRSELPSCMVMRDSYSTQIFDLIAERMDTTHYLGMWNYTWDNSAINREQPDYIIYIVAEWNLDSVVYS